MSFKKLIKCPNGAGGVAGDEMLVDGDVEVVDLPLLPPNRQEIWLLVLLTLEMLLQAAARLGLTQGHWTESGQVRENRVTEVIIQTSYKSG